MTEQTSIDISVIIPCFNRVYLLKQTLKSVAEAISGLNVEVILVDDGSEIPICEQINEFLGLPVSFIRQENSGLTTARYNGLMAAKGDFVQFLDSDDQVAPDKFVKQLREMRAQNADISHTDRIEYIYDSATGSLKLDSERVIRHSSEPAEFFIRIQPAPHSPIFKKSYLLAHLVNPIIPLSRDYDSIGEVWFYYNLSVFPAKIIKIDEPLTIIIHHNDGRLTDNWEIMGLCALSLQYQFARNLPDNINPPKGAKNKIAIVAFHTFKRLPYDISPAFQRAFLDIWKMLGRTSIAELQGGKYFTALAHIIGPVNAARIFKRIKAQHYNNIRSITDEELELRVASILDNQKEVQS